MNWLCGKFFWWLLIFCWSSMGKFFVHLINILIIFLPLFILLLASNEFEWKCHLENNDLFIQKLNKIWQCVSVSIIICTSGSNQRWKQLKIYSSRLWMLNFNDNGCRILKRINDCYFTFYSGFFHKKGLPRFWLDRVVILFKLGGLRWLDF